MACSYGVSIATPPPSTTTTSAPSQDPTAARTAFGSFVRQYVTVRAEDRQARNDTQSVLLQEKGTTLEAANKALVSWSFQKQMVSQRTGRRIGDLPRTVDTRIFIEAALEANQLQQESDGIEFRVFALGGPQPSLGSQLVALNIRIQRAWRLLDDKIEDSLRGYGLTWAEVGGRPQSD